MNFRRLKSETGLIPSKGAARAFLAGAAVAAVSLGAAGLAGFSGAEARQALAPPPAQGQEVFSFADIVEDVAPSVVSILVEREVDAPQIPSQLEEFFFRFGEPWNRRSPFGDEPRTMSAQGSGFFIDAKGHIVTNNHVVNGATRVRVVLNDGEELDAEIVGADPETDLAVLKVEREGAYPYVEFAEDVNLRVGDWVVAVGNPFGLSGTVTSGIVSAIGRETPGGSGQFTDFIQVDAPINRGNSGGPTFDLKGRVVGVNTAIYSTNGGSVGIGFAIPARVAKNTVEQLIEKGAVTRGWLGVQIQDVTEEIAAALGREGEGGALVVEVIKGTPAAKSGLKDGDLIVSLDGEPLESSRDLTRSISSLPPGAKAKLKVLRDDREKIVNVTLGKRDSQAALADNDAQPGERGDAVADLGLRVAELDDELRAEFRVPDDVDGVIVTGVRGGSPAAEAGLRRGVVILQVDGEKIANAPDLAKQIDQAKDDGREAVLLRMQVGGVKQFGALPLDAEG